MSDNEKINKIFELGMGINNDGHTRYLVQRIDIDKLHLYITSNGVLGMVHIIQSTYELQLQALSLLQQEVD